MTILVSEKNKFFVLSVDWLRFMVSRVWREQTLWPKLDLLDTSRFQCQMSKLKHKSETTRPCTLTVTEYLTIDTVTHLAQIKKRWERLTVTPKTLLRSQATHFHAIIPFLHNIFLLYPCVFSSLRLRLHNKAFTFYFEGNSVVLNLREVKDTPLIRRDTKEEEGGEKKPINRQDSNQQPLWHEACALTLCYNCCPFFIMIMLVFKHF